MPIPNIESNPLYDAQSVWDSTEVQAKELADAGTGWTSGCFFSLPSGMGIAITSGVVLISGVTQAVAATTVVPANGSTNDRKDIVVVDNTGVPYIVAGAQCGTPNWTRFSATFPPVKPFIPVGSVILYEVYVVGGATSLATLDIVDKRESPSLGTGGGGSSSEPFFLWQNAS